MMESKSNLEHKKALTGKLSTKHVPITRMSQSLHNPFFPTRSHSRIKFSNEFINYKPIKDSEDSVKDSFFEANCFTTPHKLIEDWNQESTFGLMVQSILKMDTLENIDNAKNQFNSDLEKEMDLEIKLHTAISEDIESQLKLLSSIAPTTMPEIEKRRVILPKSSTKPTILLDLDDTLIYSLLKPTIHSHYKNSYIYRISYRSQSSLMPVNLQIIKRPYLEEFLTQISKLYEIIVKC